MNESKEKFTPGPWYASGQLIFAESKKHPIAAVDGLWLLTGNTFEANAALIAAAPEMYALLSNILNDLETDGSISLHDNAANDIRMLLAKARGGGEAAAMTSKDVTAALLSSAQTGFENILFELKSILETYLDKLNEDDTPEPDKVTETVRLLARTVEYKHEQLLSLAAHCDAYNAYRYVLDSRRKKKEQEGDDEN